MTSRRALITSVVALALLSVPATAEAAPPSVAATCGAVLKTNAHLKSDLTCTGDAVTLVGAVTLDLRGHRLTAKNGTAVRIGSDRSAPRIRNGSIENSATGITTNEVEEQTEDLTRTVTVDRVTLANNGTAINVDNTSNYSFSNGVVVRTNFLITGSHIDNNLDGISGIYTGFVTLSRSGMTKNQRALRFDTGAVSVQRSRLERNDVAMSCLESSCAISRSRLKNNIAGISGEGSIADSVITGSKVGYHAFADYEPQLTNNIFKDNETAVRLESTEGGTLSHNRFLKNGIGFTATYLYSQSYALLDHNLFQGNRDGITVTDPGTQLKGNVAIYNRHYGIYAPAATDLGENRARRNGYSPQCTGVVC